MELPPFHHHSHNNHHRYVPPPSKFSENPNFYHPNSHLFPPPPLPPLQQQQRQQTPPPLPSFPPPPPPLYCLSHPRPHLPPPPPPPPQSQFSFRPRIEERPVPAAAPAAQFSNFIPPHLLNQLRPLSPHRIPFRHHHNRYRDPPFHDDISRSSDPWPELPPLPRAPIEPDLHYHHQRRPLSPLLPRSDNYRDEIDRSDRFRDEFINEGFRGNANQELPLLGGRNARVFDVRDDVDDDKFRYHRDRDGFGRNINSGLERNIDRINRDFVSADSQGFNINLSPSREFTLNVSNYEPYNDREEDLRWGYSRFGNNSEYIDGDGVSFTSHGTGRELSNSGYDDVNRLSNDSVGEGIEEFFSRSPRKKQVHKKSALLRIQLGKDNIRNNNRNRSHDNSRYSSSYYDESNSSGGGSFKGKEKDASVHQDFKMEREREESPVELDVSFKSNALVAKAIKTTSSPLVELGKNLAPRNRKRKKINVAHSPGIKLCDDLVKFAGITPGLDSASVSDKGHRELTEKIISFKSERSAGGLDCPSGSAELESAEKDMTITSDSCASESDFPSGCDKGQGSLAQKMSVYNRRTDAVNGSITGAESAKLTGSHQGVKRTAPVGLLKQIARKSKKVRSALPNGADLQSMNIFCESTNPDNSAMNNLSSVSQLDDGVTHSKNRIPSTNMDTKNDFISPSLANTVEKVTNASEDAITYFKEDDVSISTGLPLPSECSALISVSSDPGDASLYLGPGHVDRLVHDGLSRLKSDTGLVESQNASVISGAGDLDVAIEHPCLNGSSLVENDLAMKVIVSPKSNVGLSSLEENKVHDSQIDTSASNHDACTSLTSDEGLCRKQGDVTFVDTAHVNADSKEFLLDKINAFHDNDIDKDSPDPNVSISPVGSPGTSKIEEIPVRDSAVNQDSSNNISSFPKCSSSIFSDSLGNRTVSEICLLEDSVKDSIVDGAATLLVNAPGERSSKSMVSSSSTGKKRKDRDDQLDVHGKRMRKIARPVASVVDDDDRNSSVGAKNLVSVEEEVDFRNGVSTLGEDCSEDGPSEFNPPVQEGKDRKDFSLTLTSPILSEISQGPKDAIMSYPSADPLSNSGEGTTQAEDRVAGLTAYLEASFLLQADSVALESYQSLEGGTGGQCSKIEHRTSCQPKWETSKKDDASLAISTSDNQLTNDILSGGGEGNFVTLDKNQKQLFGDGECENHFAVKENVAALSNDVSFCADVGGLSASSSTDRHIDSVPDTLSNVGSPEDVISNMRSDMLDKELRLGPISYKYHGKDGLSNKNPVSGVDIRALSQKPSSDSSKVGTKSGDAASLDLGVNTKAASLLPRNTLKVTADSNTLLKKSSITNNRRNSPVIGNFSGHTSARYASAAKVSPFNHTAKPRTWHRTLTSSPSAVGPKTYGNYIHPERGSKKEVSKVQSSYVRLGNSLVRKPSPVGASPQVLHASSPSVHELNSGTNNARKGRGSENRIDVVEPLASAILGASNSCPERPKMPPLMGITTIPGDSTFSLLSDPPRNLSPGVTNDLCKSAEDMDTRTSSEDNLKSSRVNECQTGSSNDADCQVNADERNSGKKILYVKRKSNQLVATSISDGLSSHSAEKTQMLSSDGYYKRRKNQLIRTSLKEGGRQRVVVPGKILSSRQQDAQKNIQSRSSSKRQSGKGFVKKKHSLVWTLHGPLSSRKDVSSGRWQRVIPHLFPWKRATNWTNFMNSLSFTPNDNPVSTIGQKLLLSRKRDAIYKRSVNGFSLRRSKVFSVGGRSLKWSKSIERNSRKAHEDATLALVAAEKRKKAQNCAAFTLSKSRNYVSRKSVYSVKLRPGRPVSNPGERIFRIGSERYRMDSTRKTLHRISDEQPSHSDDQSEKNRKKFYVPRRLLIGSDEYIRIGNGNQLVRDPKRRTRILANEKVRWSLHTARLRLARKKKYCQFFTRFGKCNKDDKKCPYVHDPSKIAVCTKFLNGSCFNPDCKLTHQVIPERMQDCSYFLQGVCSNESCPYRHVNVNPNSPICEGFLRGYCADGNECRKKHTYVCPVFEATGNCPEGSRCKLHHPKKKRKGLKRKALNVQKNARGRYFGARPVNVADCRAMVSGVISGKSDNKIFDEDGKFVDFISLDINDEDLGHAFELRSGPTCDSEGHSDMQVAELDELTKPIRLMNKNQNIASSPAVDSSSEMTTGYVSVESCSR